MSNELGPRVSRRQVAKGATIGTMAAAMASQGAFAASGVTSTAYAAKHQDKPFAGQKLVVEGPAYMNPHMPEQIIPMFEAATGAEVEWLEFPGGEEAVKYASYVVAADGSSDVLYAWETVVAKFGPALLEDITGKVDASVMADLVPACQTAFNWGGLQYGLPFDSNMTVFMWNTELYAAAGLDPETPPQNWAEFIEFSTKLTTADTFGTIMAPGFFPFAIMINSTGSTALSDDLKTLQVNTPEGLTVLQGMADLFASGAVDPISESVPNSIEQGKNFRSGRFGHYIAFPNHYRLAQDPEQSQIVDKAKTGIIPGLSLRSGTSNGIEGFAINKNSENKDLALAFLEFTMSAEAQSYVALTWGRPPASASMLASADVQAAAPQFATVLEQAQYPAKRYGSPFYGDLDKLFTEELLKLVKGEQSVADTAAALQDKGQTIVDEAWAAEA